MNSRSKAASAGLLLSAMAFISIPMLAYQSNTPATDSQVRQINTVAPPNATFPPAMGTPVELPTPLPTVGPGQLFDEGDSAIPQVGQTHGDDMFGWGKIVGESGLVLVWITDENGTHYVVVDDGSDLFLGSLDEVTGERMKDGIEDYIERRSELEKQRLAIAGEGISSGAAVGILAWGLGFCAETGGAGCVVGLVGGIAVAIGNAARDQIIILGLNGDLKELDHNLDEAFAEASSAQVP